MERHLDLSTVLNCGAVVWRRPKDVLTSTAALRGGEQAQGPRKHQRFWTAGGRKGKRSPTSWVG
eukprot:9199458-Pyramimonas_sp.AAC.1